MLLLLFGEMVDYFLIQNPVLHGSKIRFLDWLDSIVTRDVMAHDNSLSLLWQGVEFKFVGFSCCFVVVPHITVLVHPLHFLLCCQPIILSSSQENEPSLASRMPVVVIILLRSTP
jgi:hypothetical protein